MRRLQKWEIVPLVILLVWAHGMGIWMVDIGVSTMMGEARGLNSKVIGLGFVRSGKDHYHMGLILSNMSFLCLAGIATYSLCERLK